MIRAILLTAFTAASLASGDHQHEHPAPPKDFTRLAKLLGHWEANVEGGKKVQVWFKLISGGTTLLQTEKFDDEPEMITVYHPDGKDLVLTHYCSANNQPRMKAVKSDEKSIFFDFVSVTNLASPDASHMRSAVITFIDDDHYREEWTWREKGKSQAVTMDFERKK
ncbi:MAG: hypothetical protein HY553_01280 [Elusimicrobia bacterium]|nr:hypothetical protein [Elusimicrobiota bacterium]